MKSREQIKQESKMLLRTGRVSPLIVSAIVIVVQLVLNRVVNLLQYSSLSAEEILSALRSGDIEHLLAHATPHPAATFVSILTSLVMMVLIAGYNSFLMGIHRGQEMPYASLADGLSIAGKVIWCQILMGIKIALWSLLLWIPGIIAAYRYRFAIYNLIDHPDITASAAIAMSCRQTQGLKGSLFVLDLSLIGWNLLSTLTGGLAGIWVQPYTVLCDLGYYEMGCAMVGSAAPHENRRHDPNDTPWEF